MIRTVDLRPLGNTVCKAYIADAEEHPRFIGSFVGIWGVPGLQLDYVRMSPDAAAAVFASARDAMAAGREAGYAYLNRRPRDPGLRFDRLTPEAFAEERGHTGLTETQIAAIWGTTPHRVLEWEMGRQQVPFGFWWLFPLLNDPEAREAIQRISETHINLKVEVS